MDPLLVDTIAPFLAILSLGTMVLVGMKLRYNYKARIEERSGKSQDIERLDGAVGELIDEVHLLRDGLADLNERVEFTERMLTSGKAQQLDKVDPNV